MLENLHIQNFRLFRDFKIENLAPANLIVGKNNVGKSTLLEAIGLVVSQNPPAMLATLLENRGEVALRDITGDEARFYPRLRAYDIAHLFFGHELQDDLIIELASTGSPNRLRISYRQDLEQLSLPMEDIDSNELKSASYLLFTNGNEERDVRVPLDGDVIDIRRLTRLSTRALIQKIALNYVTTKGFDYESLAVLWDAITLTPKEDNVIKMLQILDSSVERISFTSRQTANSGILIKRRGSHQPVPLGSMGDGMHRILTIAASLSNSENGYLLVDEIDTGLHYRTITDMWRVVMETAVRLNVQVFATTHSWDCERSFAEALNMQDDKEIGAFFRLQRRDEQIEAVRYDAERLTFAIEQDIEVR